MKLLEGKYRIQILFDWHIAKATIVSLSNVVVVAS